MTKTILRICPYSGSQCSEVRTAPEQLSFWLPEYDELHRLVLEANADAPEFVQEVEVKARQLHNPEQAPVVAVAFAILLVRRIVWPTMRDVMMATGT